MSDWKDIDWNFIKPAIEEVVRMAVANRDDLAAIQLTSPDGEPVCMISLSVGEHAIDCMDKAIQLIDVARSKPRVIANIEVDA